MEAVTVPMSWSDLPDQARPFFRALRSPEGERMVLEDNVFIETILPAAILRQLSEEEMEHYRRPFRNAGEDRRPTLSWPRTLPLDGEPAEIVKLMEEYSPWLAGGDVPKLLINGEPGQVVRGAVRQAIRGWRNQAEFAVKGRKLLQEDSPDEIGAAIADFVGKLRA